MSEKLGKFGHHPDPAIDFEVEVETIQSSLYDVTHGVDQSTTIDEIRKRIATAMEFRVGGDAGAVTAKQMLRGLETEAAKHVPRPPPVVASDEAERFRLLARHYMKALVEIVTEEDLNQAQQIACEALGSNPPKQDVGDEEEDESLVLEVAKAIALHGIGRDWDDFEDLNVHDFDHHDLKEYARAAIYRSPIALLEQSERQTFEIAARLLKERDEARTALKLAIDHIEHMAAFVGQKRLGYSFESLGEDMPGMKAALASTATEVKING